MAIDPVCEMTVEPRKAAAKVEYQGVTYYFCSDACHKVFTANLENYARMTGPGRLNADERGNSHTTRPAHYRAFPAHLP